MELLLSVIVSTPNAFCLVFLRPHSLCMLELSSLQPTKSSRSTRWENCKKTNHILMDAHVSESYVSRPQADRNTQLLDDEGITDKSTRKKRKPADRRQIETTYGVSWLNIQFFSVHFFKYCWIRWTGSGRASAKHIGRKCWDNNSYKSSEWWWWWW